MNIHRVDKEEDVSLELVVEQEDDRNCVEEEEVVTLVKSFICKFVCNVDHGFWNFVIECDEWY